VTETPINSFWKGLFIQLTNPKPALFWLSMVSVVIARDAPTIVGVMLVSGVTAIAFAWHLVLAFACSLGPTRSCYLKARRSISLLFGVLFIALGGRLILGHIVGL
jgi:threonine/homoserine/homoserine lactone efflux protein